MVISVSYVVTVYNKAACIQKMVESLFAQEGEIDAEYIFVDDGSSDDSLQLLQEFTANHDHVKVLTQKNQGPAIAFNKGLKEATKDWVYIIDGDDYIMPDATVTLVSLANKYQTKYARGRFRNYPAVDKKEYHGDEVYIEDALGKVVDFYPIGASTAIFDRKLAMSFGGCDERVFVQDYSLSLRLALHTSFVEIDKILAQNIDAGQPRLSSNKLIENADTAKARCYFICDNIDKLNYRDKYTALRRQLKKAWSWHRKTSSFPPIFSKHLKRYIISRFDNQYENATIKEWMQESLEVYNVKKALII